MTGVWTETPAHDWQDNCEWKVGDRVLSPDPGSAVGDCVEHVIASISPDGVTVTYEDGGRCFRMRAH